MNDFHRRYVLASLWIVARVGMKRQDREPRSHQRYTPVAARSPRSAATYPSAGCGRPQSQPGTLPTPPDARARPSRETTTFLTRR